LKAENKKSNKTCLQRSNLLKIKTEKTKNENTNQTHP